MRRKIFFDTVGAGPCHIGSFLQKVVIVVGKGGVGLTPNPSWNEDQCCCRPKVEITLDRPFFYAVFDFMNDVIVLLGHAVDSVCDLAEDMTPSDEERVDKTPVWSPDAFDMEHSDSIELSSS